METKTTKLQPEVTTIPEPQLVTMSDFCESLLDLSEKCIGQKTDNDCAILLVSDGNKAGARMCGNYNNVLNMLYSIMKNDDKVAELVVEASMRYSHHLLGSRVAKKLDEMD